MGLRDGIKKGRDWFTSPLMVWVKRRKLLRDGHESFDGEWPMPLTLRMKYKRFERQLKGALITIPGAVMGAVAGALLRQPSQCGHVSLRVANAEVYKTRYGYSYWVAHVKCRDCPEEWKLQARTPGAYSSDPDSNVFRDSR